jgi:predicted nucleotidyltransferase
MKVTHHLEYIANLLRPVFEKRGVERALIFGSYSRERETRKSDIDLMIIVDTDKRFFDRYDDFSDIYDCFRGTDIDMLIYTPDELEKISHRPFIQKILNEGYPIYEH